jgi:MFS family permease
MVIGLILTMPFLKSLMPITIPELFPIMLLLSIAGMGYGLTHVNALPVVWQLAPRDKIGAYTGVYYMVSSLGAILSPIAMSTIYTIISYLGGDQWLALFPYFLVSLLVGVIFLGRVKRGDAEPITKEDLASFRSMQVG